MYIKSSDPMSAEATQEIAAAPVTHVRQVIVHTKATADQLAAGKVEKIFNANAVFQPNMPADLSEEEEAKFKQADFSKAIITGIKLKAVHSNCDEPVTVSMKMFDNSPQLSNSAGWHYSPSGNEMTPEHTHMSNGFLNIATIMPHEASRPNEVVYSPESGLVDSRYIDKYGSYVSMASLKKGINYFEGEDYCYVRANPPHVVLRVLENNWDKTGFDHESEPLIENKYKKIGRDLVDSCINQLYTNVIQNIPFSKWSNLRAKFSAPVEMDGSSQELYKVVAQLEVSYKYP